MSERAARATPESASGLRRRTREPRVARYWWSHWETRAKSGHTSFAQERTRSCDEATGPADPAMSSGITWSRSRTLRLLRYRLLEFPRPIEVHLHRRHDLRRPLCQLRFTVSATGRISSTRIVRRRFGCRDVVIAHPCAGRMLTGVLSTGRMLARGSARRGHFGLHARTHLAKDLLVSLHHRVDVFAIELGALQL